MSRNVCSGGAGSTERRTYSNNVGVLGCGSLARPSSSGRHSTNLWGPKLVGHYVVSVFGTGFFPVLGFSRMSNWIEPLHVIKCLHFSAVFTQYCNKTRADVPTSRSHVTSAFSSYQPDSTPFLSQIIYDVVLHVTVLQREYTHLNVRRSASAHCQRKVHNEVAWQFTTVWCRFSRNWEHPACV